MAWLSFLQQLACSCLIAKAFSANLDFQTGSRLHDLTLSYSFKTHDFTYWDVTAAVVVVSTAVYVYFTWSKSLLSTELLSKLTLGVAAVVVLFLSGAAVSHVKLDLWREATVDASTVRCLV